MRRNLPSTRGFVNSMENDTTNTAAPATVPEDSAIPAEAPATSAETELIEVNDGAADGEAVDAQVEEAVAAAASLEGLLDILRSSKETGGIDENTAKAVANQLAYIDHRQGIKTTLPSMESFRLPATRPRQVQVSLESVQDTLKRVWESIIAAIKKSIAWLEEQFNNLFGAAQKYKKRAEALLAAANSVTAGTPKEAEFENERVAKALVVNGAVPSSLSAELAKIQKIGAAVFGKVAEFNATEAKKVEETLTKLDLENLSAPKLSAPDGFAIVSNAADLGYADAGEGMHLVSAGELPGNRTVLLKGPAADVTGEAAAQALIKSQGNVVAFSSKAKELPAGTKLKTLATSEVEKVAKEVIAICDNVISFKAKLANAKNAKNGLIKAAGVAQKAALSENDAAKEAAGKSLAKVAHATAISLDRPAPQFSAYALNTVKAALDYADLSLKQYK